MASEPLNKVLYFENDLSVKNSWVHYVQWCFCSLLSVTLFQKVSTFSMGFLFTLSFPTPLGRYCFHIQTSPELVLRCGSPLFPEAKFPKIPMQLDTTLACRCKKKSITSWWSSQSVPPQQLKDLVKHPEILRESGTVFQQRWVPACVHTPSLRFEEGPGYATQKPGFHQLYHLDLPEIKREIPWGNSPYFFNQIRLKIIATL